MSKINIRSIVLGQTTEEEDIFVSGIKKENKILYNYGGINVSLELFLNTITLVRENDEMKLTLKFENDKSIVTSYYIKPINIMMKVETRTKLLEISENSFKVEYELYMNDDFSDLFTYTLKWRDKNES